MPDWVSEGSKTYIKHLSRYAQFKLIELPLQSEPLKAIPKDAYLIALHLKGKSYTSETLAQAIETQQQTHSHLCFIIGGPDGLDPMIIQLAQAKWSLSPLTFPHPLCRLILLEALYRALSILNAHPYHR